MGSLRRFVVAAVSLAASLAALGEPVRPVAVQPSGDRVPANLLRISLQFGSPVDGSILPRLTLLGAGGKVVEQPFLEQELWSPNGKVLTLLLHPGRVKSGLIAHDTFGPVMRAGESVRLLFDGREVRRWHVTADAVDGPRPAHWRLSGVRAGTRRPLIVDLDAAIDGRDVDYLAVVDSAGRRVTGTARLDRGESRWRFLPSAPWRAGAFGLAVFANLEDPAGNRMSGHFEQAAREADAPGHDVTLPFLVR